MCNIPVWDNNTIDADLKLKALTPDCLVFLISSVKFKIGVPWICN